MTRDKGVVAKAFLPTNFDPADVVIGRRAEEDFNNEADRREAALEAMVIADDEEI